MHNGYKLYNLKQHRVVIARNIVFDENKLFKHLPDFEKCNILHDSENINVENKNKKNNPDYIPEDDDQIKTSYISNENPSSENNPEGEDNFTNIKITYKNPSSEDSSSVCKSTKTTHRSSWHDDDYGMDVDDLILLINSSSNENDIIVPKMV